MMRKSEKRTSIFAASVRQRMLDPTNKLVDRLKCERICMKERQTPRRMTEQDWVIFNFCIPDKFKRRRLPKSRGQILERMGN